MDIDGKTAEWTGFTITPPEPLGDAERGFPDLGPVRAFANRDALYLSVAVRPGTEKFEQFEFVLTAAGRRLRLGWAPNWDMAWAADETEEWTQLPGLARSSFALGDSLEARIALADLGSPKDITLKEIRVMGGECCGPTWRAVDEWKTGSPTGRVGQVDPPWRLVAPGGAREADRTLASPDVRAIATAYDRQSGRVNVTGSEGSVPPSTIVLVGNVELNDFVRTRADAFGRFEADPLGFAGTHILVKQDTTGRFIREAPQMFDEDMIVPGVLLRLPVDETGTGVSFSAAARNCCQNEGISWAMDGTFGPADAAPGDELQIQGRVLLFAGSGVRPPDEDTGFALTMIGDRAGRQLGRSGHFVSPFLTATGLPIERDFDSEPGGKLWVTNAELRWQWKADHWEAEFAATGRLPADLRPGLYSLTSGGLWRLSQVTLEPGRNRPFPVRIRNSNANQQVLGTVRVGDPAPLRLAATLLADEASEGARGGALAREDRGSFDVSARAVTRHDPIVPRLDWYGEPWTYGLEPYLPMIDAVDRAIPSPPVLDFELAKGELTIIIERPDGTVDRLGPAPMTRYAVKSPRTAWGDVLGRGGGELREIPQLTGDGDSFDYQFPRDGDYIVRISGHVADHQGRRYELCGTYDITVANVLDIETAMLPGTPFEAGNALPIGLTVMPRVPADITYTVTHVAADSSVAARTFQGTAGQGGWWDGGGKSFVFEQPGEYRVDVQARYLSPQGDLWAGAMTFGSVVATPDSPIVAHGRRGPDNQAKIAPPWAFEKSFVMDPSDHMQFPYFSGDVLWGMNDTDAGDAVVTRTSVQVLDDRSPLVKRAVAQAKRHAGSQQPTIDQLIQAGQMPLVTAPESNAGVLGAHPDDISLWAYMYAAAERPGVRVRELVQGNDVGGVYWRFGDPYHGQSGNGPEGDLPGDFKFLYAASVIRDVKEGQGIYAIYASGWVHARDGDPLGARVMPPFRGAAGGPDGGPLFDMHGRDIDIFFLPLAVRPGAVVNVGDTFRMAGPVMPTLPSLVEYTVTSPDGAVRTLGGRANAVGYFYEPADDFVLDQIGMWKVDLKVTHDGATSAGQVEWPYPTGGPLTPDGTSFRFFVRGNDTMSLSIKTDLAGKLPAEWFGSVRTANYETKLPDGWTSGTARVVVTMPGTVLVDVPIEVSDGVIRWKLDAEKLNQAAANFDYQRGMADTVTVTFYATGQLGGKAAQAMGEIVTHAARVPVAPEAAR